MMRLLIFWQNLSVILLFSAFLAQGSWDLGVVLGAEPQTQAESPNEPSKPARTPPDAPKIVKDGPCAVGGDASDALLAIMCSVETGSWSISKNSIAFKAAGCLIGSHWDGRDRCDAPITPPKPTAVPASPPPRDSLSKAYKDLAEKAEKLVPKTWWRDGFANDNLLLSHNDKEGPARQFDIKVKLRNKKLRNLNQCATRQVFIRKSFSFREIITPSDETEVGEHAENAAKFEDHSNTRRTRRQLRGKKESQICTAFKEPVVQTFYKLWQADNGMMGGGWRARGQVEGDAAKGTNQGHGDGDGGDGKERRRRRRRDPNAWEWVPREQNEGELRVAALETLEYFFMNYGGIWTGCFRMIDNSDCRGALAAASMVSATHILYDVSVRKREKDDIARLLVEGYLLSGLGRALLHGDLDSTGEAPSTIFHLRLADFTVLQQCFLKLYSESFGSLYTDQLDRFLPLSFPPEFTVTPKQRWQEVLRSDKTIFEPIYSHVRNWMYTEANNLIDFGPYRPLVAVPAVQRELLLEASKQQEKGASSRRFLIDVGANGFFASPKYLIDSYSPYVPFTDVIMIEPEPHFSAGIPEAYSRRYNLTNLKIYAEVNTQSNGDIINLLPSLVREDDFVVLKFDVDPNRYAYGATMEWGFIFDLLKPENTHVAALVDELYVELHFHYPKLFWEHYHSNWEALDMFRTLRAKGIAVHAWP